MGQLILCALELSFCVRVRDRAGEIASTWSFLSGRAATHDDGRKDRSGATKVATPSHHQAAAAACPLGRRGRFVHYAAAAGSSTAPPRPLLPLRRRGRFVHYAASAVSRTA